MEHEIPWVSLSPNMTKETEGLSTRGLTSHSAPALYLIKHNSFYSGPAGITHLTRSNSTMHKLHILMYVLITCENCRCNLKLSAERMCIKSPTTKTQKTEINQPLGMTNKAINFDYGHIYSWTPCQVLVTFTWHMHGSVTARRRYSWHYSKRSRCETKGMKMMACVLCDQPSLAVAEPTAILTMWLLPGINIH